MDQRKKIFIAGAVVLAITAIFSKGYHHFDEHFQILEFAGLKLGITPAAEMPWEYFFKMRSAVQPLMVVVLHKVLGLVCIEDPFFIATFLRLLSAAFAFICIWLLIKTFGPELKDDRNQTLMLLLAMFLWFGVYNEVRFSSENWGAMVMILAVCSVVGPSYNRANYFVTGALMGLSFLLRFQMGFMIIGLVAWKLFVQEEKWLNLFVISLSILVMIGAGVIVDRWFYGEWTLSCYNYFEQNIVLDKASHFGVRPIWYYVTETFLEGVPPFSLLYIGAALLFFISKPKHIISFVLIPFVLVHSIVGHKELRFMFPVVYFLPFIIASVFEMAQNHKRFILGRKIFMGFFWAANTALLLVVMFRPADNVIPLYEKVYNQFPQNTRMYYVHENPYFRVLNIHYYKRPGLSLMDVDSVQQIQVNPSQTVLYATMDRNSIKNYSGHSQLIYSGLPEWMLRFNFNHWMERTKVWYVYSLTG